MSRDNHSDWDPQAATEQQGQLPAYDEMRARCPVAHDQHQHWTLFRHQDVMRVLQDHQSFSNAVSVHLSVPNGMDPPEHTHYRRLIEPYFDAETMAAFEPQCRALAQGLTQAIVGHKPVELMSSFAQTFALQVQCAFLGWDLAMQEPLREWARKNQQAIKAQDRPALTAIAEEFSAYIQTLLAERRAAGANAPDDITTRLLREQVHGRPLSDNEIVSILRNWTAGEIGTIAASVGTIVHFLAENIVLQNELREHPEKLREANDEILRIHGPLLANRRVATCPVTIGDRDIAAGERLSVLWVSANRDPEVFENPTEFRWGRNQNDNLLYGAGIHVCPGAPLARLELCIIIEELLAATRSIEIAAETTPLLADYPASGFAELYVKLT